MSDRVLVVSSDCHAGLHIADYKPYVESKYHDILDMAVPVQVEMMQKAEQSFLIKEINDAWRAPIQRQLTGAWDYRERVKMLAEDGIAAEIIFPDGKRITDDQPSKTPENFGEQRAAKARELVASKSAPNFEAGWEMAGQILTAQS